jgi:hypothetical protein
MRQQHRARVPRRGRSYICRDRSIDQGCNGPRPLASRPRRSLGTDDGLHQAMHKHQAVSGRAHQRVAPQLADHIPRRNRITQQWPHRGRHLRTQPTCRLLVGKQQGQRTGIGARNADGGTSPAAADASAATRDNAKPQRCGHVRRVSGVASPRPAGRPAGPGTAAGTRPR